MIDADSPLRLVLPTALLLLLVLAPGRGTSRGDPLGPEPPAPLLEAPPAGGDPSIPVSELYVDLGTSDAPLTVVEFADFACRYCGSFARESFPVLRDEYVRTGRVRWRFVPVVMVAVSNGAEAGRAGACAAEQGPEVFFHLHDRLFADQARWQGAPDPASVLRGYARDLGADMAAWDACWGNSRATERLVAANDLARRAGVTGTPTFFVGPRAVPGALPLAQFRQVLDAALR